MTRSDLTDLSATELAALIRRKRVSPVELVDAVLARIDSSQASVNAFITVLHDAARAEAKAAEKAVMLGDDLGPLHGVPFSVKDLTYTAGVRTTMGSAIFENFVPSEDAVPVARLKHAGAILLGKTTTPEFGHKPLTDSPIFGVTRNPWDLSRTCGGSSGGAAAAIASGLGPLALGSDGGGSIRIPASCCGIVGLKATLGVVPHVHAPDLFGNNSFIGPMTRTIADARLVLDVIAGPDPRDPYALAAPLRPGLAGADLKGLRIGWIATAGNIIEPETLSSAEAAIQVLADMGAVVEPLEGEDYVEFEQHFLAMLQSALAARLTHHLATFRARLTPSLVETIERGERRSALEVQRAAAARTELFRHFQALFGRFDVLASPTLSAPALPVNQNTFDRVTIAGQDAGTIRGAWYPYTYPMNMTGHPAISVPCGWSRLGLPLGLQLVGPWYGEQILLDLAGHLEAHLRWPDRKPPETKDPRTHNGDAYPS